MAISHLVEQLVAYEVDQLEAYMHRDTENEIFQHIVRVITPDILMAVLEANAAGSLGEPQRIGDVSAFYGDDLGVPEALTMLAADLLFTEVVGALNNMGYEIPEDHR